MKKILFIISLAFAFSLFNNGVTDAHAKKVKFRRATDQDISNMQEKLQDEGYNVNKIVKKKIRKDGTANGKIYFSEDD